MIFHRGPHETPHPTVPQAVTDENKEALLGEQVPFEEFLNSVKTAIHAKLATRLDLAGLDKVDHEAARAEVRKASLQLLEGEKLTLTEEQKERLVGEIVNEVFALGPLEPLLKDPTVDDILVNGAEQIYIERAGKILRSEARFQNECHLRQIIDRIVGRIGRRIDDESPMVDARLPDGSRVNAVIPPLTPKGSVLSVRKFRPIPFTAQDLVNLGTCNAEIIHLLELLVKGRFNILISGGAGTGKTTMLNILSANIPEGERVITIEDTAELQLQQEHVVCMETRPPDIEGKGEVNQRALVRNALRMRPDRIIIGEVRGVEVLEMLQAMNTGHEGSIATIHANSPRDALGRIEMMMLYGGSNLPHNAMMRLVSAAVHVIVHLKRYSDGVRRIAQLTEITGIEGDIVTMHDIAHFKEEGIEPSGKVRGQFVMSRVQPFFLEKLRAKGLVGGSEVLWSPTKPGLGQ